MTRQVGQPDLSTSRAVSRSALKVSLGGLFVVLAGLTRQVVIAAVFGAGVEKDAFLTALVVPLYVEAVLLTGVPFVFIPAFVQGTTEGREEDAWALVGTFFWVTGAILALVAVGGALLAPQIVALSAPGLSPTKADLTARMLAIVMLSLPLTGLGILTRCIQNARDRFFWPAVATALGSMGNLAVLLFLYQRVGASVLAWGYLMAAALGACVTVIPVLAHGWTRLMPLTDGRVHEMAGLMSPFVLFGVLARAMPVLERYFAAELPDGNLSYLGYASQICQVEKSMMSASIATAIFPAMSKAHAQDGEGGLVRTAEYGLRLSLAVALPVFAITSAVAVPLVTLLFERGAFDHRATLSVSRIVPITVLGSVVLLMAHHLIRRVFYVTKDTHTVPLVDAATLVLYPVLAKLLVGIWGYVGLALAKTVYSGLLLLVLFWLLIRKIESFSMSDLLKHTLVYGATSLVAFFGASLACSTLVFLPDVLKLLVAFFVAGVLYLAILLRIDRDIGVSVLDMAGIRILGVKLGWSRIVERCAADSIPKSQE
jgi:putative peptidoglycan lipid II flippase